MPKPPLPDPVRDLLAQPNPAVIATVRPDGQPVTVATWYVMDGAEVMVTMDAGRKRLDYLREDPRVSLTALKAGDWYTQVSVQGRVVRMRDDDELADADRVSRHYTGRPYPDRERPRVSAWIEIAYWHGWGATGTS